MRIAIGADHAGFVLKQHLRQRLEAEGHEVVDFGAASEESTDYPDYAYLVARQVSQDRADRGVLVCSTGIGMSIAANKVAGIRAAVVDSIEAARLTREHNDANVITLGARFVGEAQALDLVRIFLNTEFTGGRHSRRVAKIARIERMTGESNES
jgi:ribose 5-phosphate isomerase B